MTPFEREVCLRWFGSSLLTEMKRNDIPSTCDELNPLAQDEADQPSLQKAKRAVSFWILDQISPRHVGVVEGAVSATIIASAVLRLIPPYCS